MTAQQQIKFGEENPYDDEYNGLVDWAHKAARGVLADLGDRCGIKWELERVDDPEIRAEIVTTLAEIIRVASSQQNTQILPQTGR